MHVRNVRTGLETGGEVFHTAEEVAARAARCDVDQTAGHVTIVGGYPARDHLYFLDRALGQTGSSTRRHFHTVDVVIGVLGPRTADADATAGARIARTGHGGGDGVGRTTRHFRDLIACDGATRGATVALDQWNGVLHHLEFLQFDPGRELYVEERDRVAVHHHTGRFVGLITHVGDDHIIGSRLDRLDEIFAIEIRGATGHLRAAVLDHHVHEGKRLTRDLVCDLALEAASADLGVHCQH